MRSRTVNLFFVLLTAVLCLPGPLHAQVTAFDNKAWFQEVTGAIPARPLPNVGEIAGGAAGTLIVDNFTFSVAAPSAALYVGTAGVAGVDPDPWTTRLAGNQVAIEGGENLNVDIDHEVYAFGFEIVEPRFDPHLGGAYIDSTFQVTLLHDGIFVDSFSFNAPDDSAAFAAVWSDTPFNRVEIREAVGGEGNEFFGRFYFGITPDPHLPRVQIIGSKRVVAVGEPFDLIVRGSSSTGLGELNWSGISTGVPDLDQEHAHLLQGQGSFEQVWPGLTIGEAGVFRLGADGVDVVGGRASDWGGDDECVIEVREDVSYDGQVDLAALHYQKDQKWVRWMKRKKIRARYQPAWQRARSMPTTVRFSFTYGADTVPYDPPWDHEYQHLEVFDRKATLAFPGMDFDFIFGADPASTDVLIEVRGGGNISHAGSNYVYLYYETIFNHEYGHILRVPHHYRGAKISKSFHLPPGEDFCIMARNATQYCSGCRAAMHLDLGVDNGAEIQAAAHDILIRYP